jgi:hypothetical protein
VSIPVVKLKDFLPETALGLDPLPDKDEPPGPFPLGPGYF